MTPLYQWATRHSIPPAAMTDLLQVLGLAAPAPPAPVTCSSEAAVQQERMLRAARMGNRLFRNNSGACTDAKGRQIRFGLGNTSAAVNKVMKSSDLIGITRVLVTPQMVGQIVGIFTCEEAKHQGWTYTGDYPCVCKPGKPQCDHCHQKAQWNFIKLVISLGGIGRFVTNPGEI